MKFQVSKVVLGVGVGITILAIAIGWVVFPQLLKMKIRKVPFFYWPGPLILNIMIKNAFAISHMSKFSK